MVFTQVRKQLANEVELENVEVNLTLLTLKPLQAGLITEFFNEMASSKRAEIIENSDKTRN